MRSLTGIRFENVKGRNKMYKFSNLKKNEEENNSSSLRDDSNNFKCN